MSLLNNLEWENTWPMVWEVDGQAKESFWVKNERLINVFRGVRDL